MCDKLIPVRLCVDVAGLEYKPWLAMLPAKLHEALNVIKGFCTIGRVCHQDVKLGGGACGNVGVKVLAFVVNKRESKPMQVAFNTAVAVVRVIDA